MAPGQKPFYIAIGVVIAAGIILIASRMTGGHPVSIPANVIVTAADTSGFHGYILGLPSAPVEIAEYADYQCPHCADFDEVQFPDLKARLIDVGKARLRFRDYPVFGEQSRTGAHAAACANDQGKFWEVKEALFRRQSEWVFPRKPMPVINEIARAAGLDMNSFNGCMQSARYAGRIQASTDEGNRLGVKATPTFLINGRLITSTSSDQIVRLVDSLIAATPQAPPARPAGATTPGGQ